MMQFIAIRERKVERKEEGVKVCVCGSVYMIKVQRVKKTIKHRVGGCFCERD